MKTTWTPTTGNVLMCVVSASLLPVSVYVSYKKSTSKSQRFVVCSLPAPTTGMS